MPSTEKIRKQSEVAYAQWGKQWAEHAKIHSKYVQKDLLDFQNSGIGKAVLAIAHGYSLEENIDIIKKYRDNVDIICVEKSLKHLIANGITPNFVIVCDANVDYEEYLKPVEDKLSEIVLFINVCGNPKWTSNGNWKDIRFFVNMDVLKSEHEFSDLSGCKNIIAAGTNVSNALLILLTQCDQQGFRNFFGYDKILMIGYDYCWSDDSYYAFNKTGNGKENYMKTVHLWDLKHDLCYTSSNLLFSAQWADKYIKTFNIKALQCSRRSILAGSNICDLAEQMQYKYKTEDTKNVTNLLSYKQQLTDKLSSVDKEIYRIGRDHYKQVMRTI